MSDTAEGRPRAGYRTVAGSTGRQRGQQLAGLLGPRLADTAAGYRELFGAAGLAPDRVAEVAAGARGALRSWAPDLAEEIEALAAAAGLDELACYALNARTEVLATSPVGRDCSAIARAGLGGQTWDWHAELAGGRQLLCYPDTAVAFITLTEAGILAKIGVNAAGLGLLFNILGHRADPGAPGVPVHAVARRVLDSALDVAGALAIIRSAPLAASSCFTVFDADRAVSVEASSAGVRELPAEDGWAVHTNHFLDERLAAGDLRTGPETDTLPRLALLRRRLAALTGADSVETIRRLLDAHEADGAPVCCHAPATGQLGTRWQTLATVVIEPAARRLSMLAGGPCQAPGHSWTVLTLPPLGPPAPEFGPPPPAHRVGR